MGKGYIDSFFINTLVSFFNMGAQQILWRRDRHKNFGISWGYFVCFFQSYASETDENNNKLDSRNTLD